jgi:hypothetical protein
MKLRLICASLLILSLGIAQDKPAKKADSEEWPVKMFQVKYANVGQLREVLSVFGAFINADGHLKVLTVRAPEKILAAIEESIKLLDVPPAPVKNVELTVHLLIASPQPAASALPAELDPTIKQLKAVFNYKGYRLLETLLLRTREGQAGDMSGTLASGSDDPRAITYEFHINSAWITADAKDRVFRISNLKLHLRVPIKGAGGFYDAGITTDIDAREGQKVVVGKANIDNSDNALILVLTAKVVD